MAIFLTRAEMRRSIFGIVSRRLHVTKSCSFPTDTGLSHRSRFSTASTDRPLYKHIDDVERLDYYRPGGYHPIQIGDVFCARYRVVHKLGYGSYSTIWLARDENKARYVAIKVGIAECDLKDAEVLGRISASAIKDVELGSNLVPLVLGRFSVDGPNGTHPYLVTAPAGCGLVDSLQAADNSPFQLYVARSMAAQLAMAVSNVHEKGYVHGDLHMGNILLRLPNYDNLSPEQLYDKFDAPEPEAVIRADNQPISSPNIHAYVYAPMWLGIPSDDIALDEAKIMLTDFGTAFQPAQEERFDSYTPLQMRPPEVRFEPTKSLSYASDIWSLGCAIWAVLGVKSLLDSWLIGPDDATVDQVDFLGPLPDEWWEAWERRARAFISNGVPKEGREVRTLDQRFQDAIQAPRQRRGMQGMDEEERDALLQMIRGMLAFRPGDRPSARQVLQTEWMRKWAFPEAEKTWGRRFP